MTDSTEELLYLLTTLAGWYTLNSHQLSDDKLAACLHRLRQEQLQAVLELARLLSGTKTYPQDQNLIMPTRSHNIPIPGLPTPDSSTNHPLNEQRVGSLMVSDPSDQASQFEHRYPHGVNFEEESTDGPTRTPPQLVVPAVENESVAAEPQRARTNISGGRQLDSIARDRETERTITHGPKRSNPTTTKPHVPCSKKGTKRKRGESDQSIRELEARFPKLKVQEEEGAWLFSRRSENLASNDKILDSERSKSLDLCELRIDQDFFDQLDGCKGSVHEFLGKIDTHKVTGKSEVTRTFRRAMKAETSPPLTKVYGRFACYSFYELLLSNGSHNGGSFRRGQLQATVQQLNSEDPEHQVSIKHVGRQADIGKKLHHMIKKHFFGDPGYLFVLPISLSNDRCVPTLILVGYNLLKLSKDIQIRKVMARRVFPPSPYPWH